MMFTRLYKFRSFTEKKKVYFFHAFDQNPVQFSSVIPCGVLPQHSNAIHYYVKCEKCKINHIIFPSDCEACEPFPLLADISPY